LLASALSPVGTGP